MFDQKEKIELLVSCLAERGVSLYHACQAQDFESYLNLGGIPSRKLLEETGLPFTPFDSDDRDKQNGVWDKVFGNLNDSGNIYHCGGKSIPPAYGPILLLLDAAALLECQDVAICLRSAGGSEFNRHSESLSNVEDIDRLFQDDRSGPKRAWLRSTKELKVLFPKTEGKFPEVSCTVTASKLGIEYVRKILIDPIQIEGNRLFDWVYAEASKRDERLAEIVKVRETKRETEFQSLISVISGGARNLNDLVAEKLLEGWARDCKGLNYQFRRYAQYLVSGTLSKLVQKTRAAS